jgi:hypothetical protein
MNPTRAAVIVASITTTEQHFDEKKKQTVAQAWRKQGWPVEMLETDPLSARIMHENAVFSAIKFHGLEWEWKDKQLFVPVKVSSESTDGKKYTTEMRPWEEIKKVVRVVDNTGWLLLDGVFFGEYGLCGLETNEHRWDWKELTPAYYFKDEKPNHCFVDVITSSYEHEGWMGFGAITPHGHAHVEIGDDQGNVYSVGQYPNPYRDAESMTNWIYGTTSSIIMSPEPYTHFGGEKVVHRYYIGEGEEGRKNVKKVKKMIEDRNAKRADYHYNTWYNNCANLTVDIEKFVVEEIKGQLVDLNKNKLHAPGRKPKDHHSASTLFLIYQIILIFLHRLMCNVLFFVPKANSILGKGIGVKVKNNDKEEILGALKDWQWKTNVFPKNLRVRQLFDKKFRKHVRSFSS